LAPIESITRITSLAKMAEEYGYRYFVHADQRFNGERDVFVTLTADALSTKTIRIGPCVSDPYTRIPGMLATAIASLDEVSGHRALLTLGAGGVGFKQLHLERKHPNTAIREALIIIKRLLRGEEVTFDGKLFKTTKAKINFPTKGDIPIFIATRSPKNLELAGELADGAVLASYASPEQVAYAVERVKIGATRGNRKLEDIKLIAWLYTSVSDNSKAAVENVRPFVTQALINTSPEMYPIIFKGFPGLQEFIESYKPSGISSRAYEDRKFLTDDVIRRFSVAGTPQECVEKIKSINKLGVNTFWIRPFAAPFSERDHEKVFIPFAEKVMSQFR